MNENIETRHVNEVKVNEVTNVNEVNVNEVTNVNEVNVNEVINVINVNVNQEYDSISLLMRQTTYTREECIDKLKYMSVEDIIKEYLGIVKKDVATGTTNQNIFKVIRDFF